MADNPDQYCMCIVPPATEGTRAALLNAYKWPAGARITVKFLEGSPALQQRVFKVAQEWVGPQMANLALARTRDDTADIRVAFMPGRGSWSYLGTYCRQIPRTDPTMNFGWLTDRSDDRELRRVVLHEFGHALGLIHEHQNPDHPIRWNRAAVLSDLKQPPNNWDEATIENNMFKKYAPRDVTSTPVDSASIMMYPIPAAWTLDGFSAALNGELSSLDKEFVRLAYPQ
jgi:hypothetical protein